MLELAFVLLLAAGPADCCTLPADAKAPGSSVITVGPTLPSDVASFLKQGNSGGQGGNKGNSGGKGGERGKGNRPSPGPVPLALLALGACGVAGAMFASRRRRRVVTEAR